MRHYTGTTVRDLVAPLVYVLYEIRENLSDPEISSTFEFSDPGQPFRSQFVLYRPDYG